MRVLLLSRSLPPVVIDWCVGAGLSKKPPAAPTKISFLPRPNHHHHRPSPQQRPINSSGFIGLASDLSEGQQKPQSIISTLRDTRTKLQALLRVLILASSSRARANTLTQQLHEVIIIKINQRTPESRDSHCLRSHNKVRLAGSSSYPLSAPHCSLHRWPVTSRVAQLHFFALLCQSRTIIASASSRLNPAVSALHPSVCSEYWSIAQALHAAPVKDLSAHQLPVRR